MKMVKWCEFVNKASFDRDNEDKHNIEDKQHS